jgi:WD40 repeat protein
MRNRKNAPEASIRARAALPDSVAALDVSPDGRTLGTASFHGEVSLFDTKSLKHRRDVAFHSGGALAVAFDPTGQRLISSGQDGVVSIVDVCQGTRIDQKSFADGPISHLAWSADGRLFATAGGRVVRIHAPDGAVVAEVPDHASTVLALRFAPTLAAWISVCYGGVHRLGETSLSRDHVYFARTSLLTAQMSACGRFLAAGAQEAAVFSWDLQRDDECVRLEGFRGKVSLLEWSPDSAILATAGGNTVVLWSFVGGDPHAAMHIELSPHPARVLSLGFSENGHFLWTGCADGVLRGFDLTKSTDVAFSVKIGAPLHLLRIVGSSIVAAATDGSLVVLASPRSAARTRRKQPAESRVEP